MHAIAWAARGWAVPARGAAARAWAACAALAAAERGRFALWLPLLMAGGAALYLLLPAEPPAASGGLAALAAALSCVALRRRPAGLGLAAAALAVALGFASGQVATWRAPPLLTVPRRAVLVQGRVQAVERLPQGRRITVAAPVLTGPDGAAPPASRVVRLRLRNDDPAAPRAGDGVEVRALLSAPSPPAYPGAWDLQRDAFFGGIGAYGFALGRAEMLPGAPPGGLAGWLQAVRETVAARVARALSGPPAAVAITLLTGDPSAVAPADKAAFRDSGLAHLLAIAGLHIGIVMGLAFGAVRLPLAAWEWAALRWPTKQIAALAALAAGGCYMLLTGAHVPIVRSFAMACLFTLAVLAGRRAVSLRGWALAMAVVVALSPDAVLGVSFQMSFSAVLALIAGYDALRPALLRLRGAGGAARLLLGELAALALTSALAGGASAPFAAYHFGRIQIYFVLANLLAVPITAFWIMPAGLLALLLMPLHAEALALVPMGWGEQAVLWIARRVAALPHAALAVPAMPEWGLVAVALGLAWLGLWRTRWRILGLAALAAGLLSPLAVRPPDILVSADARLIGLRTEAGLLLQATHGTDKFTQAAWETLLDVAPARRLPADAGTDAGVVCDAAACRWQTGSGAVVLLRAGAVPEAACAAVLLLSAQPLRQDCRPRVPQIDRFTVWREGAQAVWLGPGGARILTERAVRGVRPWAPAPFRRDNLGGLPMAPADQAP